MSTRTVTITPPAGYFAAVQIEQRDGTIVGAETCQNPDGTPRKVIGAHVKTRDKNLVLRWVYENSNLGTLVTEYGERADTGASTGPLRKFTCGERDWLEEHGVDVKDAQRFPRGMTLAEIRDALNG